MHSAFSILHSPRATPIPASNPAQPGASPRGRQGLAQGCHTETVPIRVNRQPSLFVPSACTHQVAEYLCETNRQNDVVLIGYDLVEENRKHLKSGAIDFLISQRPAMQGYEGVYSLFRHVILKEPVAEKLTVPIDILTQDNVDYYQG